MMAIAGWCLFAYAVIVLVAYKTWIEGDLQIEGEPWDSAKHEIWGLIFTAVTPLLVAVMLCELMHNWYEAKVNEAAKRKSDA